MTTNEPRSKGLDSRTYTLRFPDEDMQLPAAYARLVSSVLSDRDVLLSFVQPIPPIGPMEDSNEMQEIVARIVARVLLAPDTAKDLMELLAQQLGYKVVAK